MHHLHCSCIIFCIDVDLLHLCTSILCVHVHMRAESVYSPLDHDVKICIQVFVNVQVTDLDTFLKFQSKL